MVFKEALIKWYEENKRALPWRDTNDPYRIWVSEIILQQTRVDQGLSYYFNFLEEFPDITALANASLDKVLRVWQGLGYYSRARHIHEAARDICDNHRSLFPFSYSELVKLKGIGDYSASAIASIAFNEPCPVIDGNVMRVIARYAGIDQPVNAVSTRKRMKEILGGLIDKKQPGTFNQAIMELGALVCLPRNPRCGECPLAGNCYAHKNSMTVSLPVKQKARPKMVHFYHYFIFLQKKDGEWFTWLNKRTNNGIWKNLYDFPLIETSVEISQNDILQSVGFQTLIRDSVLIHPPRLVETVRHILTHRDLRVSFRVVETDDLHAPGYLKIAFNDWHNYPVPRLIENILKKLMNEPGIFSKFPDKQ